MSERPESHFVDNWMHNTGCGSQDAVDTFHDLCDLLFAARNCELLTRRIAMEMNARRPDPVALVQLLREFQSVLGIELKPHAGRLEKRIGKACDSIEGKLRRKGLLKQGAPAMLLDNRDEQRKVYPRFQRVVRYVNTDKVPAR